MTLVILTTAACSSNKLATLDEANLIYDPALPWRM